MNKEAMKLALEHAKRDERHLNHAETRYWCRMYRDIAEKAVEALAKPDFWEGYVPEPVKSGEGASATVTITLPAQQALDKKAENARELGLDYEPAQQEPEQSDIFCGVDFADGMLSVSVLRRRADDVAELLHAEQIELPAQQEPVARQYQNRDGVWKDFISEKHYKDTLEDGSWPIRNLYTLPPAQRTWVSLTDEELSEVYNQADWDTVNGWEYERAIEAKLKEKNT